MQVLNTGDLIFEQYEDLNVTSFNSSNKTVLLNIKRKLHINNIFEVITINIFFNIALRLLFEPFRGFFIYSLVLILSFVGLLFIRKKEKMLALSILLIFFLLLFINASRNFWWAGTTFGPRYLLLSIPFLSIPLGIAIEKLNQKIVFPLILISVLINFMGMQRLPFDQDAIFSYGVNTYNYAFFYRMWHWKIIANPIKDYYLPNFIHYGPKSVLIEAFLGINFFPFLNILILVILLFVIKPFNNS